MDRQGPVDTTGGVGTVQAARQPRLAVVVLAGSLVTAISLGVRSTFGLYLSPVSASLGTPRASFALAVAIQNLVWGLGQPLAGAIADRYGAARVLAAGGILYGGGMMLMGSAGNATALYLSAGFVVGLGLAAASFAVVLAAIGRIAPPHRRSMALGIATAMGSVGQFVLVPAAQALLDAIGWQQTVVIMGAIAVSVVAASRPLRGRADDHPDPTAPVASTTLRHELRRARLSRSYLLLNAGFFVCGFHVTFIATHLPSYVEDLQLDRSVAATALALIGLFNIIGSFTAGALGGRLSKTRLLTAIYGARAVVITALVLMPPSPLTIALFGAAIGLLWLATVPLTSGIVVNQFGTTHAGTLFGIVFLSHQIGAFFGAWFGGFLADAADSYQPVWWVAVGLGLLAAVVHLFVDDGPVSQPPPAAVGGRRPRLRPAISLGGATVVAGAFAAATIWLALNTPPAAASPTPDGRDPANAWAPTAIFCVLHPTPDG